MKLIASALVGALIAGSGVYLWRDVELDARQERVLHHAALQTQAELRAEQLERERRELRREIRLLMSDRIAPPLTEEPDGRYFGFIGSVTLDMIPATLTMDFAEFLAGDRAQEAAEQAGVVEPGEPVPNDYFISNVSEKIRMLTINPEVRVRWLGTLPDLEGTTIEALESAFTLGKRSTASHRMSPWWITIEDGAIVEIEEQYLP